MSPYAEAFVQGFKGAFRLAINLIRAPFIAWRIVSQNFHEESDAAMERLLKQALRRETKSQ